MISWESNKQKLILINISGVCELGGKLYCIGGWNGQVGIRQCDVFDPETQQWTNIAPLQTGNSFKEIVIYSYLEARYITDAPVVQSNYNYNKVCVEVNIIIYSIVGQWCPTL